MRKLLWLILFLPALACGQTTINLSPDSTKYDLHVLGGTVSYVADYQTVYDAMTTPPSSSVASAQNTIVQSIGTYWDSLDIFYCYAQYTNDDDEALINWITPGTYDGTAFNSPTFTSLEGFTGNGSNTYIDCNWNPSTNGVNYTQNSASVGIYNRTDSNGDYMELGASDGTQYLYVSIRNGTLCRFTINDATLSAGVTNSAATGMYILVRGGASYRAMYKNKSVIKSDAQASTGTINKSFTSLAYNAVSVQKETDRQVSFIFAGASLSQTAVNTITDAIEAYMDSNGKGIIP